MVFEAKSLSGQLFVNRILGFKRLVEKLKLKDFTSKPNFER